MVGRLGVRARLNSLDVCGVQVPWMQLGTPFLMTSTVSANVADDMAEFEAENPGRWTEERFRSRSSGLFRRSHLISCPFLFGLHLFRCMWT